MRCDRSVQLIFFFFVRFVMPALQSHCKDYYWFHFFHLFDLSDLSAFALFFFCFKLVVLETFVVFDFYFCF